MKTFEKEILRAGDLAEILNCSEKAIRIRLSRGQEGITIPRSKKIGGRRVWLRKVVFRWLDSMSEKVDEND